MPLSIVDPEQWKLPDPQRMLEILQSLRSKTAPVAQKSSMWIFSSAIAPVDLYAFLKSRFGPPNGFQMLLRLPSVDNLIHWNYTLECPESILDLLGMNTRMEAHAWSADLASSDWRVLEANLQQAFLRSKDEIRATQETFERWNLFLNPYQRLSAVVERYAKRLRNIKIPSMKSPPVPATPDQMERFRKEMATAIDVYHEATALCVSLEMIAPVMGEAAINLFTLILGKPEIRNDERLREDFARRPIDVRIKTLHLVCEGFAQPVRGTEQAFKDFLRIMNRRNDALHGNIDPRKSTGGGEIFFDFRTIPLPKTHQSLSELALANAMANLTPASALADVDIVHRLVEFLLSRLSPEAKAIVERAMLDQQLGFRPKTGIIGLILPAVLFEFFPVADRTSPKE